MEQSEPVPALVPVLAANMKRLMETFRENGLHSESQLSKKVLRKTLVMIGLQVSCILASPMVK